MRLLSIALTLPLLTTFAEARPAGTRGRDGGALAKVSAGIQRASSASTPSQRLSGDPALLTNVGYNGTGCVLDEHDSHECLSPWGGNHGTTNDVRRKARPEPATPTSRLGVFAGAQKVHDSDGAASLEVTVSERRLRVSAGYQRYFERQPDASLLTMSMPSLLAGVRIDDFAATQVVLEGGVIHVRTRDDVMGDSSMTGPIAGMRVEHAVSPRVAVLGDVQQMWLDDDVRATAGRVAIRYRYLQAGFRVLDFNVGPALFGPEVGVRF